MTAIVVRRIMDTEGDTERPGRYKAPVREHDGKDDSGMEQVICREITERDMDLAQECVGCPLHTEAGQQAQGVAPWFARAICSICPYGKAYASVYGHKMNAKGC